MQLPFHPYPEFQTERLVLNQLTMADDLDILTLRSDERVNRYINRDPMAKLEASHAFIQKIQQNTEEQSSYYWAVRQHGEPRLIGTACLFHLDQDDQSAELGYELMPEFQGWGLMREAIGAVIRFAQTTIQVGRLDAWIHAGNMPSLKLATHFGFTRNPHLEEIHRDLPELRTMQILSLAVDPNNHTR